MQPCLRYLFQLLQTQTATAYCTKLHWTTTFEISFSGSSSNTYQARGLRDMGLSPGGALRHFCEPLYITSISSSSTLIGDPPSDATESTIKTQSLLQNITSFLQLSNFIKEYPALIRDTVKCWLVNSWGMDPGGFVTGVQIRSQGWNDKVLPRLSEPQKRL